MNSPAMGSRQTTIGMSDSLTERIITTVAEADEQSGDELKPLYNVINTEALESLFASRADGSSRPDGKISFQYVGYWVTVSSDGTVEVEAEDR